MKYENDLIFLVEPFFHGFLYIELLKNTGCEVVVLRREDGPYSSEYKEIIIIDFDNTKEAAALVKKRIARKNYRAAGIIPGNDFSVPFTFALNEALGFKSNPEATGNAARDKALGRKILNEHKLLCPKSICFHSLEEIKNSKENFDFPVVVKPTDMTNSAHVKLANNMQEVMSNAKTIFDLQENILKHKVSGAVLVEEYARGPEFSIELFFVDGEVKFSSITQKHKGPLPHFVEIGHTVPAANTTEEENKQLLKASVEVARAIGLRQGPAHIEMILTDKGASLVEISARIGGGNIMKLVREATGVYLPQLTVDYALGYEIDVKKTKNSGAAIRFLTASKGTLKEIKGFDEAIKNPAVFGYNLDVKAGDKLSDLESSADRFGFIMTKATTGREAYAIAQNISEKIIFKIEK